MAWTSRELLDTDRRYGCSCIGAIIALIIISMLLIIPSIIGGYGFFVGGPFFFIFDVMIWLAPFVILGLVIKLVSNYREGKEREDMLADS